MLQSAIANFAISLRRGSFVSLRSKYLIFTAFFVLSLAAFATAQSDDGEQAEVKATPTPAPLTAENGSKEGQGNFTAEQIVEQSIFVYAFPGGRARLDQIRKTTSERGKLKMINAEGKFDTASYLLWAIRGENSASEKIRLDQQYPTATYSLVSDEKGVFGIYNNSVFVPREDAVKAFENRTVHGIEAYLRYKENGSTLELAGREKRLGVEFYQIDVTDKQGRKTRFLVSVKSFRIMMLEYEDGGTKYLRKFYDYNYAQGTLVPYHSVLYVDDKIVEEIEVNSIVFGQKVEETLFARRES